MVSEARTPSKALVLNSRADADLRSSNAALQQEVAQYRLALAALRGQQDSVDSRSTVAETTKDVTNKVTRLHPRYAHAEAADTDFTGIIEFLHRNGETSHCHHLTSPLLSEAAQVMG